METITQALEREVPHGNWCARGGTRCKYLEIKKPFVAGNGIIQSYYCRLTDEYVNRKMCGINEQELPKEKE